MTLTRPEQIETARSESSAIQLGTVVQLLSALACLLAAIVLPWYFPSDIALMRGLMFAGAGFFVMLAILSRIFRQRLARLSERWNLDNRVLVPREGFVFLGVMLLLAVAALTGGSPVTGNSLLLIFGLMAGSFVVNGWFVLAMKRQVTGSRSLPAVAWAGVPFSVWITVTNSRRKLTTRLLQAEDDVEFDGVRFRPGVTFLCLEPGSERVAAYRLQIPRRGRVIFHRLQAGTQFPLGLGRALVHTDGSQELLVAPCPGRLLPAWSQLVSRHGQEHSQRRLSQFGREEEEFAGIREYRGGDRLRQVHWLSTARTGGLKVRDYRPQQKTSVSLILDLHVGEETAAELPEQAISLAATVCSDVSDDQSGSDHCLILGGTEVAAVSAASAVDFRRLTGSALAECQPSAELPVGRLLQQAAVVSVNRRSRWLVLTTRPQAWRGEWAGVSGPGIQILHLTAANLRAWFRAAEPSAELLTGESP